MTGRVVDRDLLPRTFGAWFGRFHDLTEVQRRAIPPIMEGRDVLICSPTASGKTEAYAAPAAEIALAHRSESAAVVIVSPTRALANDLKRRLEGPMGLVDLTFGRYTGEHKEKVGDRLPTAVVTTPEALDSMLARRPHTLASTRVVVLDEIHVLDGTPRGDQLRLLLHRFEGLLSRRPQIIAASATVDRPAELAARYQRDPIVIPVPGTRSMRCRAFDGRGVLAMGQHLDDLAGHGFRKVLVFCRSRNQVETFSTKLYGRTRFQENAFAHHGSIAKTHRERTERLFHQAPSAVCFATLTLEMGIDIGTVDYVLLADIPSDVASLLQRIGRGSRRGETTRAGYVVDNAAELHIMQTMFRLGRAGHLCPSPYTFRPSVLVQQALVIAASEGWIDAGRLAAAVPKPLLEELGPNALPSLLDRMVENELLERVRGGRYVVTESIEGRYDRGVLHSNISDEGGIDVIDRITGDTIGRIEGAPGNRVEIGGAERSVVRIDNDRMLTDAARDGQPARFRPSARPAVSQALARAVVEALGVPSDALALVSLPGSWSLLHGLGTVGSLFLSKILASASRAISIEEATPYTLTLAAPLKVVPTMPPDAVLRFVTKRLESLEKMTNPGPWKKSVPDPLRIAATWRGSGIDDVVSFLASCRLVTLPPADENLRELLLAL